MTRLFTIILLCALLLLPAYFGTCDDNVTISIHSDPNGKQIKNEHFSAGTGFFLPGTYYGTLPSDNPENKRKEFAEALKKSGIRTLRFPNGNHCHYYLFEGWDPTLELKKTLKGSGWQPEKRPEDKHFTNVYNFLRFCKDFEIDVIYELPTFFYYDGTRPRAITNNSRVQNSSRKDLFDRNRIEEAVAYIEPLVKFCKDNAIPVVCWEIGNEEFAHMHPADFAKIVKAYTELLDKYYDKPSIAFVMQGPNPKKEGEDPDAALAFDNWIKKQKPKWGWPADRPKTEWWLEALPAEFTKLGMKNRINRPDVAGTWHYAFSLSIEPETPEQKKDHALLLKGDLSITSADISRWYSFHDYDKMSVGITETNAARNKKWDHHVIRPSYAYGLSYVQYWIGLLKEPRITMSSHHELETTFFGMMRYDVIFDTDQGRFMHIARLKEEDRKQVPKEYWFGDQYVLSGTCYANSLLSKLAGSRLDTVEISAEGNAHKTLEENQMGAIAGRTEEGRHVVVMYNKTDSAFPVTLHFPEARVRKQYVLTARSISSMLEKDLNLETTSLRALKKADVHLPPFSVVAIEE